MKIIGVIPAYNEEKRIATVVAEVRKYCSEVIVVNDGSADSTADVAREAGALVVSHSVNMGLGFSLRTGAETALKRGAEIIVTIDGDGQHDASEIPRVVAELENGQFEVVIGGRPNNAEMPFYKQLGNQFIYWSERALFGSLVVDTQSGFRAFRASVWPRLVWRSRGYSVSSEIVKNIATHKLKFVEIPVKTIYHDDYKGTRIMDGVKIVAQMVRWKVKDLGGNPNG